MPEKSISDEITTVAGIASAIREHALSYGIDIEPICKSVGLDPASFDDLQGRISLDRLCRLLEACALLSNDEAFGLTCARRFVPGSSGAFGYGLMSAPTVRDFVRFLADHMHYAIDTSHCTLQSDDRYQIFSWTFSSLLVRRDQYFDMALGIILRHLRDMIGAKADLVEIELERPKPRNIQIFREVLVRKVRFSCPVNSLKFPLHILELASPRGDARLHSLMGAQCRAAVPQTAPSDSGFVEQVRNYIQTKIADPVLSLAEIAPYFGMSERTFQRRLSNSGTSLNDLRDEIRKEISFRLITGSDMPIAEICYRLGYSAPSAFTRSVSRWFGTSPKALREKHISSYDHDHLT